MPTFYRLVTGERQHVSDAIAAPEFSVETPNRSVSYEADGERIYLWGDFLDQLR